MSALAPGLYRATVNGVPDAIVMMGRDEMAYLVDTGHLATRRINSGPLTDARPLIVLDLDNAAMTTHDLRWAEGQADSTIGTGRYLRQLADQIEAQVKPARIEEPGLWGVVEAHTPTMRETRVWTHGYSEQWFYGNACANWADLIDPALIREGLRDGEASS